MTTAAGSPVEGFALRLFDPHTHLWRIYSADGQNGSLDIPVAGSFDSSKGYFFANYHFTGGKFAVIETGFIKAIQDIHERRFASAIFTQDNMNFTSFQGKIDMIIRTDTRKTLGKTCGL